MLKTNRLSYRNQWNRSQKRRYQENEIEIQFDWNKPLNQCCRTILIQITSKESISNKPQLLAYLTLFTKYCLFRYGKADIKTVSGATSDQQNGQSQNTNLEDTENNLSDVDILCCLRLNLFHESPEIRAASLRSIRYFVQTKSTLNAMLQLNLQHLISRSLDLILENRVERIQAMRLIRHLMTLESNQFPLALARCLCAISHDSLLDRDTLLRVCWATISELTIVNPIISAKSGCINVLVRCALNAVTGLNSSTEYEDSKNRCQSNQGPSLVNSGTLNVSQTNISISEAILSSFMHLYNFPDTRRLLQPNGSDLFYFISPFTDLYSFYHASEAAKDQRKHSAIHLGDDMHPHHPRSHNDLARDRMLGLNRPGKQTQQQYQQQTQMINNEQMRKLRYLACKNAILSIFHSWPGMFFMCRVIKFHRQYIRYFVKLDNYENEDGTVEISNRFKNLEMNEDEGPSLTELNPMNPLESLISILHSPYPEVQRHILSLFFEIFGHKPPELVDNFDDALSDFYFNYPLKHMKLSAQKLQYFDQSNLPEEWQLYDGFIVKEANDILPCLANDRLNFIVNYHALLLQSLVEFELLEALICVILNSSDQKVANLATILVGELIHLSGKYLSPSSYAHRCQSFPTLVAASISGCRERRNRALMTISNLDRIHNIKKLGPRPTSLFLEQQIQFCQLNNRSYEEVKFRSYSTSSTKSQDDYISNIIKSSLVLRKQSSKDWNWEIIVDLLKNPPEILRKLDDKEIKSFVSRLKDFFLPSKRQFSSVSKNSGLTNTSESSPPPSSPIPSGRYEMVYFDNPQLLCKVATYLIDFLLRADEAKASELIEDFIRDLERCLKKIASKNVSMDEILIASRLSSTLSHHYFILIGRFSHFTSGQSWLNKTNIYQYLIELINESNNEVYTKLIVSSLDYNQAGFPRKLLSKVLTSPVKSARLYATQFIRVLLRAGVADFDKWSIDLLINQLYDQCPSVSLEALDILDEAFSDNPQNLDKLWQHRSALLKLGDRGIVFLTRFASYPSGMQKLTETNMLINEVDRWRSHYCIRYVRLVEDSLNECFTCHQKGSLGKYGRRSDRRQFIYLKTSSISAYLIPHLYGQLANCPDGLKVLMQFSIMQEIFQYIESQLSRYISDMKTETENRPTEIDVLRMKAAIWSVGHVASSEIGIDYVIRLPHPVIYWITLLIERSPILSIRATGFHVICLIGSTYKGANTLKRFGWTAIQHPHNENFPIDQQEFENFHPLSFDISESQMDYLMNDSHLEAFSKSKDRRKSVASMPWGYSFASKPISSNDSPSNSQMNNNMTSQSHPACQFSISSNSSSNSSSYLSIMPSKQGAENSKFRQPITEKSQLSSSSASLYSNTSSLGSLMTPGFVTLHSTPNNILDTRNRSSSDCVATNNQKSSNKNENLQDSGTSEQSIDTKTVKKNVSSARNRKISAPCFPVPSQIQINGKLRSDSNESNKTNTENSRSTSFNTEYSTASSGISSNAPNDSNQHSHSQRTVQFNKNLSPTLIENSLEKQQTPVVIIQPDDPYPSPKDAYGYAKLRQIQKRRVQSLSGSMFFNYGNLPDSPSNKFFKFFDDNEFNEQIHHSNNSLQFTSGKEKRSFSGSSSISETNSEIQPLGLKTKFMCLCLPQKLSLIFHLEEGIKFPADNQEMTLKKSTKENFDPVHERSKCLACCNELPFSHEQDEMNDDEVTNSKKHRLEVLRLVSNLYLPNYAKQAEQGLLSLKQKFPLLFEDFCLYSDVCQQIESTNFKAAARRFLHELFMDINLDRFHRMIEKILKEEQN